MKEKFMVGDEEITVTRMPEGADLAEWIQHELDNCPDCQAARARGEAPVMFDPAEIERLAALQRQRSKPKRWAKPMRWRKRKQQR